MPTNDDILDRKILSPFNNIFKAMNISEYKIVTAIQNLSLPLDFETRDKLLTDGLLAAENFEDEWIEISEPQLYFKYKKRSVIMYQRDQFLTQYEYNHQRWRPFHLCFCQALQDAHEKNRYESRYVMTYRTDGFFKVNLFIRDKDSDEKVYTLKKEQEIYRPLKVCQHCLREINWKHFRQHCGGGLQWWYGGNKFMRQKIVDEFDLEEYLTTAQENNFFDHPVFGTASSTIKKEYVLSAQIKEELKKIVEYTCDICHNQFPADELQIHHKNHNEGDNRRQNLMVVCENCHALIHEAEGGFFSRKTKSVKPIEVAAEKYFVSNDNYADVQKRLGDMHFNGWGVDKDEAKANFFYKRAADAYKNLADQGDVDAQFMLATNFDVPKWNYENIFAKYKKFADDGNFKAKIRLGFMYVKGLGVQKNLNAAKEILASIRKSVRIVDSELIELCILAGNIDDALKYHAKAVQLLQIAINNGDSNAAFELAKLNSYKDLYGDNYEV